MDTREGGLVLILPMGGEEKEELNGEDGDPCVSVCWFFSSQVDFLWRV